MYIYVFDDFTQQNKYQKSIQQISKRLTDLGLNGKIIQLGISKNISSSIEDEIRRGAKTIVAVGNDQTTLKTLNAIAMSQSDEKHCLCLGVIPLEPRESHLSELLGISNINDACEILLARRLKIFNAAAFGQNFFLFRAAAPADGLLLDLDKNFIVQPAKDEIVEIINDPNKDWQGDKKLVLKIKHKNSESLFSFREAIAVNQKTPIILDGSLPIALPARISMEGQKIKIIVGKGRVI
ncbi:MAG: hypothetical protein WC415_03665 [Patescibacteria group bacterium]|jgi:hypothetical protein